LAELDEHHAVPALAHAQAEDQRPDPRIEAQEQAAVPDAVTQ